jgi:hypothetical protein
MDEQDQIECQEVMDALTGIKTFIPGTYIFQQWRGLAGRFKVRYRVVSRTAKTVTLEQMPATAEYRYMGDIPQLFRIRVNVNTFAKCEINKKHGLWARNRC